MKRKMYGIPEDGSKPFLMCVLDGPGKPEERAEVIYKETSHLYIQKLKGYKVQ